MAQADNTKRESEIINIALNTYLKVIIRKHNSEENVEIKALIAQQAQEIRSLLNKQFISK